MLALLIMKLTVDIIWIIDDSGNDQEDDRYDDDCIILCEGELQVSVVAIFTFSTHLQTLILSNLMKNPDQQN